MIKQNSLLIAIFLILWCPLAGMAGFRPKPSPDHEVIIKTKEGTICTRTTGAKKRKALKNDRVYYGFYLNELFYKQGVLQGRPLSGKFTRYDIKNNIIESGQFNHGLKVGQWKHLTENGHLTETAEYRKGSLCGKRIIYSNGVPVIREKYQRGKLSGKPKSLNAAKVLAKKHEKHVKKKKVFQKLMHRNAPKEKIQPNTAEISKEKTTND